MAPEAVRQAVGGGCQSGWGRLLSVTNAVEPGAWCQVDSGWAGAGRPGGGGGYLPPSNASLMRTCPLLFVEEAPSTRRRVGSEPPDRHHPPRSHPRQTSPSGPTAPGERGSDGPGTLMAVVWHGSPLGMRTPGGATTTGPDATSPQLSAKTCGRGGGGRREGGGGGGGLHATHYYHMHTSRVCVCLGAWGYRGTYAIIAISRLCQEESLKGLKDQRHRNPLQLSMGQKIWRRWRHGPYTAIFQNWGGGGGAGGCRM